jgi:hypothetical protein
MRKLFYKHETILRHHESFPPAFSIAYQLLLLLIPTGRTIRSVKMIEGIKTTALINRTTVKSNAAIEVIVIDE